MWSTHADVTMGACSLFFIQSGFLNNWTILALVKLGNISSLKLNLIATIVKALISENEYDSLSVIKKKKAFSPLPIFLYSSLEWGRGGWSSIRNLKQEYLEDTVGLVPEYHNKANISIKWVTQLFHFPSGYKSYIYTIL